LTKLSGTILDSRRLAPKRAARRGQAHGWAEQSPANYMPLRRSSTRAFCVSGGEGWWTNPPVTRHALCFARRAIGCADVRLRPPAFIVDKCVWNDKDIHEAALKRAAREAGPQEWAEQSLRPGARSQSWTVGRTCGRPVEEEVATLGPSLARSAGARQADRRVL
jgi:hypothetical protein